MTPPAVLAAICTPRATRGIAAIAAIAGTVASFGIATRGIAATFGTTAPLATLGASPPSASPDRPG